MANQYAVPVRRFGETTRPDAWWIQPLAVFLGLASFLAYSTWAMFQPLAYAEFGPYLSPMYSPLLFGPSPHSWFGGPTLPTWWPPFLHYSAAALDSVDARSGSASPAITTAAPTTRRSGPTRRGAPSASRGRNTSASGGSRSSSRTSTATSCTSRSPFIVHPELRRLEGDVVPDGSTVLRRHAEFGIGVGTLVLTANACCSALHVRLPLAAPSRRRRARRDVRPAGRARRPTRA